jgi:hypothetical protein
MMYAPIPRISRDEAETAFAQDDPHEVVKALLGLALYDPDWRWVQAQCLRFCRDARREIRRTVPLCFMHLAYIHRTLDTELVLPALEQLRADPDQEVSSAATEYLSYIQWDLASGQSR